ncbi:hypothetical protein IKF21_00390 [Candidatus Saccharibacteria bacterium]|nr:hypothetical protein [Candidatus Saccharibacteria bacterium]
MGKKPSNYPVIVGLFLISLLIGNLLLANKVQAATCKSVSQATNDSIYDACRWSGARGTLWISDSSSSTSVSSKVRVSGWESGDGKVTAYLHGAIIGGNTAYGSHIKLIKSNAVINGLSEANRHSAYSVFSDVPSGMKRHGNSRTGTIRSNIDKIYLNVKELRKIEKPSSVKNGKEIYKIPIQGFRCYSTNGSNVAGGCYSSKSTLNVEVKLKKVKFVVVSRDTKGKSLNSKSGLGKQTIKAYYDENVKAVKGSNNEYTFKGWKVKYNSTTKNCTDKKYLTKKTYNKNKQDQIYRSEKGGTIHDHRITQKTVVCAIYEKKPCTGSGCNPTPHTGDLTVDVRNRYTADYAEYTSKVYAKPGDKIDFRVTYRPTAQSNYNSKVDVVKLNGSKIKEGANIVIGKAWSSWENIFSFGDLWSEGLIDVGVGKSATVERTKDDAFSVEQAHVGSSLTESARVSDNTPRQVSISSDKKTANIITTPVLSDSANVIVPYNFETDAKVTDDGGVVFAGESKKVDVEFAVNGKGNSLTTKNEDDTYATKVSGAIQRIITYTSDEDNSSDSSEDESEVYPGGRDSSLCGYLELDDDKYCVEKNEEWNTGGGVMTDGREKTIDVPDVNAGKYVCVAAAVFPSSSGNDDNISPSGYTNEWKLSGSRCFVVAKKPSVQVWGGNVFSAGKIETALAEKKTLAGYSFSRAFGSWAELGVISKGAVNGFGSGASLGYEGVDFALPGGGELSNIDKMAKYSPLTFPNAYMTSGLNQAGGWSGIDRVESDKSSIISKLIPIEDSRTERSFDECLEGQEAYCYKGSDQVLTDSVMDSSKGVRVLQADGNIAIEGNLVYNDAEKYQTFAMVPKLVVYAKNIYINCEVERIDALLVAEGEVKTCVEDENGNEPELITSESRSNQLRINGAVLANKISLGRTYGAATGANSIVPAEIINFDPTLYLWAKDEETGVNSDWNEDAESVSSGLTMSYTHELSPRR